MSSCEMLPINQIELDLNNPRIKHYLEIYNLNQNDITSEHIALALSAGDPKNPSSSTYSSLYESIKVNRGIINPITVNRNTDGTVVVIEGNTRLQIYRELFKSEPDGPWNKIMAIVYENLEAEKIHAIRLQAHLVGPREWDPFSKAKYLHQLSEIEYLPINTIISFCGGKAGEIRKLIDAYKDMINYYKPKIDEIGDDFDPHEFSKFAELQNRSILNALSNHGFTKKNFADWVVNGNIDTAQNVRKLPLIVQNKHTREVFLKSNITEAAKGLFSTKELNLSDISMYDLIYELNNRLGKIELSEIKSLANDNSYYDKRESIVSLKEKLEETISDIDLHTT